MEEGGWVEDGNAAVGRVEYRLVGKQRGSECGPLSQSDKAKPSWEPSPHSFPLFFVIVSLSPLLTPSSYYLPTHFSTVLSFFTPRVPNFYHITQKMGSIVNVNRSKKKKIIRKVKLI